MKLIATWCLLAPAVALGALSIAAVPSTQVKPDGAAKAAYNTSPPLSDMRLTVHTLLREDVFAGFLENDMTRLGACP